MLRFIVLMIAALEIPLDAATITGRVTDDSGKPLTGAVVNLLEKRLTWGRMVFGLRLTATTGQDGSYRIEKVESGRYRILVDGNLRVFRGPQKVYRRLYYPGDSETLKVRADQDLNFDFQLIEVPGARIHMTVGGLAANSRPELSIRPLGGEAELHPMIDSVSAGRFTILDMPPGHFVIDLSAWADGVTPLNGTCKVELREGETVNVVVNMKPRITVSGKLVMDDASPLAARTSISFFPGTPGTRAMGEGGTVEPDGSFQVTNLSPGRWDVVLHAEQQNVFLRSVKLGEKDLPGLELEVTSEAPTERLNLVVSKKGAVVRGSVAGGGEGKPYLVMAIPDGDNLRSGYRTIESYARNGNFQLVGLTPGAYTILAVDEGDRDRVRIDDVKAHLGDLALRVEVKEGARLTIDLKPATPAAVTAAREAHP